MGNNNNKQRLLIEYIISSPDTFALCKSIVKANYFDPDFRKTVAFVHTYYDKYSATPTSEMIEAETGLKLKHHMITRDQIQYCSDEIESFCRRKAIEHAVIQSAGMIEDEDYGKIEQMIKDAVSVSLNRQIGLTYFDNPMQRLEKMAEKPQRTSTKWTEFDELLGGGLARTEMLLLSANSGGGKSITLANLALNFLTQPKYPGCKDKMDVLYISLELSEEMIAQRFDTMYTGISSVIWQQNYKEIATAIETLTPHMGRLTIKRMPVGTNCNTIRAYLKEFELKNGYVPDMLIVDYLDIMGANEHVSADNVFEKDKRAAEQLRDVGFDYNMFIATASQQNRTAVTTTELNHSHIAGGISKINTVDWYVSIIMNATMKAAGEIGFSFLKTRSSDGVGKQIFLRWDNTCLRIFNHKKDEDTDEDGVITAKIALHKTNTVKRDFTDLFDIDT